MSGRFMNCCTRDATAIAGSGTQSALVMMMPLIDRRHGEEQQGRDEVVGRGVMNKDDRLPAAGAGRIQAWRNVWHGVPRPGARLLSRPEQCNLDSQFAAMQPG